MQIFREVRFFPLAQVDALVHTLDLLASYTIQTGHLVLVQKALRLLLRLSISEHPFRRKQDRMDILLNFRNLRFLLALHFKAPLSLDRRHRFRKV